MARTFKDGATTTYDAANAKFVDNPFGYNAGAAGSGTPVANGTGAFEYFNFGSLANFKATVDNSIAGEMRDCGECHVGGGMMEYANTTRTGYSAAQVYDPAQRTSLREASTIFGSILNTLTAFIDIFNPDPAKRGDVVTNDYAQTGVMEMDCLICHADGYDWSKRKEAIRKGEFDASRAIGAGLATSAVSGVEVVYDPAKVFTNVSGNLIINLADKLNAVPKSENCNACHQSQYNVDWKKRGDMWLPGKDVHYGIGCMGCHERKDAANPVVGTSGLASSTTLGLCDPAKGGASPFDAMWNKLDKAQFKECTDCHTPATTPTYSTYNAPNPVTAHTLKGLDTKIAFNQAGVPASHLEIMDCSACHVRKSGFTGGAFVDGTGADEEGRVALHDQPEVSRDMTNGVTLHWQNGKLHAANLLTSMFWRDVNGLSAGIDVNNDGRTAGMDAVLQTHINDINLDNGLEAIMRDGVVTPAEITTHLNAFKGLQADGVTPTGKPDLKAYLGTTNTSPLLLKLSGLMVPFKASHNIAAKTEAWGAKGCKDCHAPNAGFYNGTYPINGNMEGKFTYSSAQVTAFTKVNGLSDATDSHPNVMNKKNDRSMPVQLFTIDNPYSTTPVNANATVRNIDRSEMIYEPTFKTLNAAWFDENTPINGATRPAACSGATSPFYCAAPGGAAAKAGATSTLGWLLKIDTTADNGVTVVSRTKQISSDIIGSVDDIIANLGAGFASTNFEFIITGVDTNADSINDALRIQAKPGFKIRLNKTMDVGPFGFGGVQYPADPIVRPAGTFAGRAQYVSYLDAIGAAPVAEISTVKAANDAIANPAEITVTQGAAYALAATVAGTLPAASYTYTWGSSDVTGAEDQLGQNVTRTFTKLGTYTLELTVKNNNTNEVKVDKQTIKVVAPAPATTGTTVGTVTAVTATRLGTIPLSGMPAHTRLIVTWGDGGSTSYTETAAAKTLTHVYFGAVAGKTFTTIVKVVNGSTIVETITVPVTFP